jgi:hypothetical protein
MGAGAVISPDGIYRYGLWRDIPPELGGGDGWSRAIGTCLFVMLNPSTADANKNDPTITRCMKFAKRWGFERLAVGNLYARRATDPKSLLEFTDPVGPDNDEWLRSMAEEADEIVVAWGGAAPRRLTGHAERVRAVIEILAAREQPMALGLTGAGDPKHPLARGKHRVPDDVVLENYWTEEN